MIKLLYKLFKAKINSFVFEKEVIHNNWKDLCEIYYIDTKGRRYYKLKDLNTLPTVRLQYLNKLAALLRAGFNEDDKDAFIDNWQKKIDEIINTMDVNGRIKNLAQLRTSLDILKTRFDVFVEPDVLLAMQAVILIREDEEYCPKEVSDSVIDEKVRQFKEDDKLRDAAFFLQSGLTSFISFLQGFEKNWVKSMESWMKELVEIQKLEKEIYQPQSKK